MTDVYQIVVEQKGESMFTADLRIPEADYLYRSRDRAYKEAYSKAKEYADKYGFTLVEKDYNTIKIFEEHGHALLIQTLYHIYLRGFDIIEEEEV